MKVSYVIFDVLLSLVARGYYYEEDISDYELVWDTSIDNSMTFDTAYAAGQFLSTYFPDFSRERYAIKRLVEYQDPCVKVIIGGNL